VAGGVDDMSEAKDGRHLTNLRLITCVVERGMADKVVAAAMKAGAPAATISFARGSGIRERLTLLLKIAITEEKEVIDIVASEGKADGIFDAMVAAAGIDLPGKGIIWMTPVLRAVTHVPQAGVPYTPVSGE
jgi:nitrogen regulatory protein P-II 1